MGLGWVRSAPTIHQFAVLFSLLLSFVRRSPFSSSFLSLIRSLVSFLSSLLFFFLSFVRRSPFSSSFFPSFAVRRSLSLFAVPTRPTDRPTHSPHRMGGTAAAARRGRKRTGGPSCRHGAEVGFGVVAGVVRWVRVWGFGSILGKKQINKEV